MLEAEWEPEAIADARLYSGMSIAGTKDEVPVCYRLDEVF